MSEPWPESPSGPPAFPAPGAPAPGADAAVVAPGTPDPTWQSRFPGAGPGAPGTPGAPWAPPPFGGAAHKPGAVPLRPLRLGDLFDGAFRIIRFNPRATVGSAAGVAVLAMALPVLVTVVSTLVTSGTSGSGARALGLSVGLLSFLVGLVLLGLGLVLVTGMVAAVTREAALGRLVSLSEAWAATRGRRWRLMGLTLVQSLLTGAILAIWILFVVGVALGGSGTQTVVFGGLTLVFVVLPIEFLVYTRLLLLSAPSLMLEDVGVFGSMSRSWQLTRGQFWRLFGIQLLVGIATRVAVGIIAAPFSIIANISLASASREGILIFVVANAVGNVVKACLTTPFRGSLTTLLYLDQRIRKEGYDVELMAQAGLLDR